MSDIEITRNTQLNKITDIIDELGIPEEYVEQYGKYKAKISNDYYKEIKDRKKGKLILVTAINPTPLGEGKTTTSIGLADGLRVLGKKSILALREPSLGPVFGIKGGATGGGHSQVAPMEDINLHFTGDIHAITTANNLLSAMIDNHIFHGNSLHIKNVTWKRCVDLNDRELRKVEVGLSGEKNMVPRYDGFDITVASEIMAILCLATDIHDLKKRIGDIVIGTNDEGNPVTCRDLKADGSLTVILKDAINPNMVQTLEHTPAFIHGGPFANIAHGCNSVIATKMAMKLGEYTVTEAGFGADLGAEKFIDIKCRVLNNSEEQISPDAVVIVATLRALKYHGGVQKEDVNKPNIEALKLGMNNLKRHINNIQSCGLNPVVAINKFNTDTDEELEFVNNEIAKIGVPCSILENWAKGGKGATNLAQKVIDICEKEHKLKYVYNIDDTIEMKINKIAMNVYGASDVQYSDEAHKELEKLNNEKLPVCIAKTPFSYSDDAKNLLCDTPFTLHVQSLEKKAGAGFIVVKTGKVMTMPGLPIVPAAENIDIDDDGNIQGIF